METKISKSKQGKKGRAAGKRFETEVRADLEKQGWNVVKWTNQADIKNNKLVPAKSQYNPFFKRIIGEGSGFPDFLAYRLLANGHSYEVMGVECKLGKYLSAEEKEKAKWLVEHHIFKIIFVAHKPQRGEIKYEIFS